MTDADPVRFHIGRPVPPEDFIGRKQAIRSIFSRIRNKESTAVVGEPQIGKSSLLDYIRDERVRSERLGTLVERYSFIYIDTYLLPASYYPADFWREVLDQIKGTFEKEHIQIQLEIVRKSAFGSFTLKRLFELLAHEEQCVVLLIDQFDTLLHHDNFNTAEFFGALRSLSTTTHGLVLVTASRMSITEMNRRTLEINPLGSPFFNTYMEERLPRLRLEQVDQLLDKAMEGSGVQLSRDDHTYIRRVTGRHPLLVQIAGKALVETLGAEQAQKEHYAEVSYRLQLNANVMLYFEDLWRYLSREAQEVIVLLARAEHQQLSAEMSDQEVLRRYGPELRSLADSGLIEPIDGKHSRARGDIRWHISAASFAQWVVDNHKWEEWERPGGKIYLSAEERARKIEKLTELLNIHRQRLHERQIQEARYGIGADPAITSEINDIRAKIADVERKLSELGVSSEEQKG
jgi:hypothetical protein